MFLNKVDIMEVPLQVPQNGDSSLKQFKGIFQLDPSELTHCFSIADQDLATIN